MTWLAWRLAPMRLLFLPGPSATKEQTDTFRTDVGLGFDFGGLGVYAAKALSRSDEPVNFFLRLQRRF